MEWDDVRDLALELPDVEESTPWGAPSLKVRGRWFAGLSPHEGARGALVIRCDADERPLMVAGRPDLFYVTPPYEGEDGYLLVRLDAATAGEPRARLEEARLLATATRRWRPCQGVRPRDGSRRDTLPHRCGDRGTRGATRLVPPGRAVGSDPGTWPGEPRRPLRRPACRAGPCAR